MIYAIGDIHGHKGQLFNALSLIEADGGADAPIVFLGDYVDRGPDSKGVIDYLMAGQASGKPWTCVIGNHDVMFWRFVSQGIIHDPAIKSGKSWLHDRLGGNTTLKSYLPDLAPSQALDTLSSAEIAELQQAAKAAVPPSHLDWIAEGPRMHVAASHLFVHAGIRPGVPLNEQRQEDLIWIRDDWINSSADHGLMVVHGHTMIESPQHYGNRINLDGGAGQGRRLVPAVFDGRAWFTLNEDHQSDRNPAGRRPLTPSGLR